MEHKKQNTVFTRQEIEKHLQSALAASTPDIWSRLDLSVPQEPVPQKKISSKKLSLAGRRFGGLCAAACVCLAVVGGGAYHYEFVQVVSEVEIDVNPSLRLSLNRRDRITAASGVNEDGQALLLNTNLKGATVEDAVNQVVTSLVDQGYLNADGNEHAVLVSVSGKNQQRAEAVKTQVSSNVEKALTDHQVSAVVYDQTIEVTDELKELAETYQISPGKAEFVGQLVGENEALNADGAVAYERMAGQSMEELTQEIQANEYYVSSKVTIIKTEPVSEDRSLASADADPFAARDQADSQENMPADMPEDSGEKSADSGRTELAESAVPVPLPVPAESDRIPAEVKESKEESVPAETEAAPAEKEEILAAVGADADEMQPGEIEASEVEASEIKPDEMAAAQETLAQEEAVSQAPPADELEKDELGQADTGYGEDGAADGMATPAQAEVKESSDKETAGAGEEASVSETADREMTEHRPETEPAESEPEEESAEGQPGSETAESKLETESAETHSESESPGSELEAESAEGQPEKESPESEPETESAGHEPETEASLESETGVTSEPADIEIEETELKESQPEETYPSEAETADSQAPADELTDDEEPPAAESQESAAEPESAAESESAAEPENTVEPESTAEPAAREESAADQEMLQNQVQESEKPAGESAEQEEAEEAEETEPARRVEIIPSLENEPDLFGPGDAIKYAQSGVQITQNGTQIIFEPEEDKEEKKAVYASDYLSGRERQLIRRGPGMYPDAWAADASGELEQSPFPEHLGVQSALLQGTFSGGNGRTPAVYRRDSGSIFWMWTE